MRSSKKLCACFIFFFSFCWRWNVKEEKKTTFKLTVRYTQFLMEILYRFTSSFPHWWCMLVFFSCLYNCRIYDNQLGFFLFNWCDASWINKTLNTIYSIVLHYNLIKWCVVTLFFSLGAKNFSNCIFDLQCGLKLHIFFNVLLHQFD